MPVTILRVALAAAFVFSASLSAKVYRNVEVGKFDPSFDISECEGNTFLDFMMKKIYPAMKAEAKQNTSKKHIDGVKAGEGVELRLTEDVTTYHVRYKADTEKNAERSGRSFGAVGKPRGNKIAYVADASDAYYLDTLAKVGEDEEQLRKYYETILGVITKCDVSGFEDLTTETKQVAADFIAVYVAEEYRHLIGGKGKLGTSFNWDDALLQVTLLASYHSGQDQTSGMFYEGKFTNQVYNQIYDVEEDGEKVSYCLYRQTKNPKRAEFKKRQNVLRDYWQFNKECKRSGINLTRRDFTKMAEAVSAWAQENAEAEVNAVAALLGRNASTSNIYGSISKYLINNTTPGNLGNRADKLTNAIVALLMEVRDNADEISEGL